MIKETISINDMLELLNDMVITDRVAIEQLIESKVSCNEQLANHNTIQVLCKRAEDVPDTYRVGMLGILNGLFGISETGFGIIAVNYDVNCPAGCAADIDNPMQMVGESCKRCGDTLVLGDLVSFDRMPDKYLYKD